MSTVLSNSPALNIGIEEHRLTSPELVRDYYEGAPALAPFFAGFPWDQGAFERVAGAVRERFNAAALRDLKQAVHATTDRARARLDAIAAGQGFFVSTGQQAGLFSGPLFTIYKTLSTIRLAQELESRLGVAVAPLFWTAADDHDFPEVNHAFVFGADNELHRLEIDGGAAVPRSMQRHILDESASTAVAQLQRILPANEFSAQILDSLRAAYVPGQSVAAAFEQFIGDLFAQHDLLITSSAHPVVKSLAAPLILRELENSAQHEAAVRAQTDRLLAAGYHEQVGVRHGAANVLYEDEVGRDRLVRADDAWHLSRTKEAFDTVQLRELVATHPERFSPNVLLRPVVASAVFPTLAYVGGPAEVSYFAQIGCLFAAHGVAMPLVLPRASFEIVEHKVQKVLDKFGLAPEAFRQPFEQLASQVVRDELPGDVLATMEQLRGRIAQAYGDLVAATDAIDPTLRGPLENARNASHKALADVEKKIVNHLKKKNEIGVEQLRKASMNLYPDGKPQERVISAVSYLARYGPAFLDALAARIAIPLTRAAPEWRGTIC